MYVMLGVLISGQLARLGPRASITVSVVVCMPRAVSLACSDTVGTGVPP